MNLQQLKEFLALCKKNEVKEIVFGKVHVQFHGQVEQSPEQEEDHVVIQALGGGVEAEEDSDGSEDKTLNL